MDSFVSPKYEIWFLRVCRHISNVVYRSCSPGVNRPRRDAHHLPQTRAKVENEGGYSCAFSLCRYDMGRIFTWGLHVLGSKSDISTREKLHLCVCVLKHVRCASRSSYLFSLPHTANTHAGWDELPSNTEQVYLSGWQNVVCHSFLQRVVNWTSVTEMFHWINCSNNFRRFVLRNL
jgi:hypothetical protein